MILKSKSVQDTHDISEKLLNRTNPGTVFALIGDLGTGKTTFAQGFAIALGVKSRVGSPTFKLVSEYDGRDYKLYHIDAYRLKNSNEFLNIGGEEYLISKNNYRPRIINMEPLTGALLIQHDYFVKNLERNINNLSSSISLMGQQLCSSPTIGFIISSKDENETLDFSHVN